MTTALIRIAALALPLTLAACGGFPSSDGVAVEARPAGVQSAEPAQAYAYARDRFLAGEYGLASEAAQAFLVARPDSIAGRNLMGAIYDKLGRFDLAAFHYEKALAQAPDHAVTAFNAGYSSLLRAQAEQDATRIAEARRLLAVAAADAEVAPRASAMLAQVETAAAALAPEPVRLAQTMPTPTVSWVEQVSPTYAYVVTQAPESLVTRMEAAGVDPRIASVRGRVAAEGVRLAPVAPVATAPLTAPVVQLATLPASLPAVAAVGTSALTPQTPPADPVQIVAAFGETERCLFGLFACQSQAVTGTRHAWLKTGPRFREPRNAAAPLNVATSVLPAAPAART